MALNLSVTSGITGAGIGTIGPSGANVTGVGTFTQVETDDKIVHVGDTNTAIRFPAADTFAVETSGTQRLRVDSTGNVGLSSVPTASVGRLQVLTTDNVVARFQRDNTSNYSAAIQFGNNSRTWALYGSNDACAIQNTTGGQVVLEADTSHNVKINAGNLVIGTAGKGIDFSATASNGTSELLDDYEEGTFTITVTPGSGSYAVSHMQAHYVKVGHICHIQGWWRCASVSSASGGLILSGFPFTTFNNTGSGGLRQQINVNIAYADSVSDHIAQLRLADNHTNMEILSLDNVSDTYYTWTAGNIRGATAIYMRGSYVTSS